MIAFSLWYSVVLWVGFWFMVSAGWVAEKVIPAKTLGFLHLAIGFSLWAGFVNFLAYIPIRRAQKWHWKLVHSTARNAIFLVLLLACTIFCTQAWDKYIADKLYTCTDSVPGVFIHPGDWVHGDYVTVTQISPRTMSQPDAIKEGWSVPKLWILWWLWVAGSILASAVLASLVKWPRTCKTAVVSKTIDKNV